MVHAEVEQHTMLWKRSRSVVCMGGQKLFRYVQHQGQQHAAALKEKEIQFKEALASSEQAQERIKELEHKLELKDKELEIQELKHQVELGKPSTLKRSNTYPVVGKYHFSPPPPPMVDGSIPQKVIKGTVNHSSFCNSRY